MKIVGYDIAECNMADATPGWRSAIGARVGRSAWLLRLDADNGTSGYGYAPSTAHLGSTPGGIRAELEWLVPSLKGREASDIVPILADLDRKLAGAPSSKSAIDCALHEILAQSYGVPLHALLGGKFRDEVPLMRILATKAPAEMADDARALVAEGYGFLKVKVVGDVALDVARVAAVRAAVGPDVRLTIDANQAYGVKDAVLAINRMVEHDISLVEQPTAARDFAGLKLVTDSVPVPIEADESAMSREDVHNLIAGRIVDAVSLRVPNLGGLHRTLAVARMCEAASIQYRIGATVGSRLIAAQSLHLAVGLPDLGLASELGEFARFTGDPFTGLEVEAGKLRLPEGTGSGVRLKDA